MGATDTIRYIYYLMLIFVYCHIYTLHGGKCSLKANGYSGYHAPIPFDYYYFFFLLLQYVLCPFSITLC